MKRLPLKRIARLVARHERDRERIRSMASNAGSLLDLAVKLGALDCGPIPLPDGSKVIVNDQFAERSVAFKQAAVSRYVVKAYRADRENLPRRPRRASTSEQPLAEGAEQI